MNDQIDSLLKKSQKFLRSAAVLYELEDFDSCTSRAYFSMFYAAQAALHTESKAPFSRQRIRSEFIDKFVHNGPLPERAAEVFERASELQEVADYAPTSAVSQTDAELILAESEAFVNSLTNMIEKTVVS